MMRKFLLIVSILVLAPVAATLAGDYKTGAVVLKHGTKPLPPGGMNTTSVLPQPVVTIQNSGLATQLNAGQPADNVQRISPLAVVFYPWVQVKEAKAGETLECRILLRSGDGEESAHRTIQLSTDGAPAVFEVRLPVGMPAWPVGTYRAEFSYRATVVAVREFTIGG